jgi:death on curing protein
VREWLTIADVLAIHDEQIAEHGGLDGVRDLNVIESAVARPRHLMNFGDPTPDVAALAATLAFGLAKNHGFVDGNKRTSAVATETYLALNGLKFTASDEEIVQVWTDVGAGQMAEDKLADWLRGHTLPAD